MVNKRLLLIVVFCCLGHFIGFSQTDTALEKTHLVYDVESMPKFSGGINGLTEFIRRNLIYPEKAREEGLTGTVYVEFWVDTTGRTHQHQVLRGIRDDFNQEALRISRLLVFEEPAKQKGKSIGIWYSLPVQFSYEKTLRK